MSVPTYRQLMDRAHEHIAIAAQMLQGPSLLEAEDARQAFPAFKILLRAPENTWQWPDNKCAMPPPATGHRPPATTTIREANPDPLT